MQPKSISQLIKDAIISAWSTENEPLKFNKIVEHLLKKGVIRSDKNHASVSRWLGKLESEKVLEKIEEGYKLNLKPKEYILFDYLNELRQKYKGRYYLSDIGGSLWKGAVLAMLGFPQEGAKDIETWLATEILSIRIGELFMALERLRNTILQRKAGLPIPMPDDVDREVFFAFLDKSIGEEGTTDELVKRYRKQLMKYYDISYKMFSTAFYASWAHNYFDKPKPKASFFLEHLSETTSDLDEVRQHTDSLKQGLAAEGFIVDNHNLEGPDGLLSKLESVSKKIFGEKPDYVSEDLDLESKLETAVLVKTAEKIKEIDIDFDDFAVILTRHPATMSRYYTAEHVLYDAMKWATEEPSEDGISKGVFRQAWLREKAESKTPEVMISNYLFNNAHFNPDDYRDLRGKPWVVKELSKHADFDKIVSKYERKLKTKLRKQHNLEETVRGETKGKKPIDLNEELETSGFRQESY